MAVSKVSNTKRSIRRIRKLMKQTKSIDTILREALILHDLQMAMTRSKLAMIERRERFVFYDYCTSEYIASGKLPPNLPF